MQTAKRESERSLGRGFLNTLEPLSEPDESPTDDGLEIPTIPDFAEEIS
jgi:hypothetical protein